MDQGWLLPPSLTVRPGRRTSFATPREASTARVPTAKRGDGGASALRLDSGLGPARSGSTSWRPGEAPSPRPLVALSDLFVRPPVPAFGPVRPRGRRHQGEGQRLSPQGDELGRMKTAEPALAAEVDAWLEGGEADAADFDAAGREPTGRRDTSTGWPTSSDGWRRSAPRKRWKRKRSIRAESGASSGMRWQGRPLRGTAVRQINFTGPGPPTSRRVRAGCDRRRCRASDHRGASPRTNAASPRHRSTTSALISGVSRAISGDAANEANLAALKERRITAYLAGSGASRRGGCGRSYRTLTKTPLMRASAKQAGRRSRYRLRKQAWSRCLGRSSTEASDRSGARKGVDDLM